jgi:two-component system chemotaxis response regulator CheB
VIRVLIVDDSAFNRVTIGRVLEGASDIEVVGTAVDGYDAIRQIRQRRPDVLTLDLEMPNMDGLSLLRWVMSQHPLPVLVVTSRESNYSLFEALELGALDFVLKPGRVSPELPRIREDLLAKLRQISVSRLHLRRPGPIGEKALPSPVTVKIDESDSRRGCRLFVLVASTGGPPALQTILRGLSPAFPASIAVAQHMPAYFTTALARRLNDLSPLPVREAVAGDDLGPGQVLLAPGGAQMTIAGSTADAFRVQVNPAAPEDRHVPSGDQLLESAARYGQAVSTGIVLTGMGDDGTRGLAAVQGAGGRTLAESQSTAVVFGMPGHAIAAGVVEQALPLEQIAGAMESLARLPGRPRRHERFAAGNAGAGNGAILWKERT